MKQGNGSCTRAGKPDQRQYVNSLSDLWQSIRWPLDSLFCETMFLTLNCTQTHTHTHCIHTHRWAFSVHVAFNSFSAVCFEEIEAGGVHKGNLCFSLVMHWLYFFKVLKGYQCCHSTKEVSLNLINESTEWCFYLYFVLYISCVSTLLAALRGQKSLFSVVFDPGD